MRLLIVGTLEGHITTAGKIALSRGAKVAQAGSIDEAMNALRTGQGADLVMIDVKLDIGSMIKRLDTERIAVPVVACGIGTDADAAVAAIEQGAKEYIPLPPDAELIAAVLEAVSEESSEIVFQDPVMDAVIALANKIAPSEASVLITGESGTGKELMANHIHKKSKRSTAQFVAVNCAAIPENLLESELFGHEKGAFTGAVARRIGKFEEANGGSLLLDEISEMHPRLQAKLLRVIQEREIDRVGGTQTIPVDVRILATSNRNLEQAVNNNDFREDLFFRLNVVNVAMPPLRERPKDVLTLAKYFAKKYAESNSVDYRPFTKSAEETLKCHTWRGNVRELENTIHRSVLLAQGDEIDTDAIMLNLSEGLPTDDATAVAAAAASKAETMVGKTVAEVERDLIIGTLEHCLGNRTHAANILGISIRTLRNKLKIYSEEGVAVPMPGEG
ncbi:MAG: sigma-54-dependent Fis family transcriptional regulator [Rhodospirillaceae bacterium]|nr:sigma-54-dependent Fis family transcriptional regulator [Rhodospirillaceae bacterium]